MSVRNCFSVIGYHNSGKTTLISRMIPLIKERGLSVSTVKHAKHLDLKDSDLLFGSGSDETIALSDDLCIRYSRGGELRRVLNAITSDVLIIEGFKGKPFPNIVRARSLNEAKDLINGLTIACVLDERDSEDVGGVPIYSPEDVRPIVDLALINSFPPLPLLDCGRCGERDCFSMACAILKGKRSYSECVFAPIRVLLRVNDLNVPLKPFVEDIFIAVNSALVGTLKDKPGEIRRIEIRIEL